MLANSFEANTGNQDQFTAEDWKRAIWTQRRSILGLFLVFLLATLLVTNILQPAYKAQAMLEVLPERQPNAPAIPMTSAAADAVRLNTEAQKVGAEPVVRAVFKAWDAGKFGPVHARTGKLHEAAVDLLGFLKGKLTVLCRTSGVFGSLTAIICEQTPAPNPKEARLLAFKKHLRVTAERETRLITVVFTAPDPDVAARVTNAIVAEYLNREAYQTETQSSRYVAWLQSRLDAVRAQAMKSDEAAAEYRGKSGLIEIGKNGSPNRQSVTLEELDHAVQDLSAASAAMSLARLKLETLRKLRSEPAQMNSAAEIVGSKLIQDLTLQKAAEEVKLAGVFAAYTSTSPVLVKARAEINAIQAQINQEMGRLVAAAERDYSSASDLVDQLTRRTDALKQQGAREELTRVALRGLERRSNADSDLYSAYLRQAREAIEAVSWLPVAASIVSGATPPVEAMFPHNRLALPLEVAASALAAITIGALTELRRRRRVFGEPMDLLDVIDAPVVGVIPRVRRLGRPQLASGFETSIESIAFRLLKARDERTSPTLSLSASRFAAEKDSMGFGSGSRAITVTSTVANEGKSVLAGSLARQFWLDGARVLVIDADLRRPSILSVLRTARDCPVTVIGCAVDGTCWTGAGAHGVHVLTLADTGERSSVVLTALPQLISAMRLHYDVLIVDTPPLLPVSDALAALPACDLVLFAVRWCSTNRHEVDFALRNLSGLERERIRIVLTRAEHWAYRPSRTAYGYRPVGNLKRASRSVVPSATGPG